ncbi:hypothetical protein GCM10020218_080780 [Dactylosporangium vinaceum]
MFLSGNDTTACLLANGLVALSAAPEQADLLRRRPDVMPSAVEEILRYDGPACIVLRATYAPVAIGGGVTIPAGELVLLRPRRGEPGPAGVFGTGSADPGPPAQPASGLRHG